MTLTCVYIQIKPGLSEKFIEVTTANHRESIKEKGNLRFDFIQEADDPTKFMLYEAYESEEAAAAHKLTSHYSIWRETVQDMMAESRRGIKYKIIQPEKW